MGFRVGVRRIELGIDAMPDDPQLVGLIREAGGMRADGSPGHVQPQPQLRRPLPVRVPEHGLDPARR